MPPNIKVKYSVTWDESNPIESEVVSLGLNLREKPGVNSPVKAILPLGTKVALLRNEKVIDGCKWVKNKSWAND